MRTQGETAEAVPRAGEDEGIAGLVIVDGPEGLDEDWEDPRLDCEGLGSPADADIEIQMYRGGPMTPGVYYAAPNGEIMIREGHQPPEVYPPGD